MYKVQKMDSRATICITIILYESICAMKNDLKK